MIRLKTIIRTLVSVAALVLSATAAHGQNQRLNLSDTRLPVLTAFSEIRQQTNLGVAYNSRLFDSKRVVVFASRDLSLDEAMKTLTDGTGFGYDFDGNMILIKKIQETNDVPAKVVTAPRTSDGYRRSNQSDFDKVPSPRPVRETPRQIVEYVERQPDVRHELSSNPRRIDDYAANQCKLPRFALKTNALYWATGTPNLAFEFGLSGNTSLEFTGSYNPWGLSGSLESNRKLVHMILKPEFRWWMCERYNGHFLGAHAIYGRYNIGSREVPLLFDKNYRYDGFAVGGGVSYGYHLALAKRWGLEFNAGMGVLWLKYDRFDCTACSRDYNSLTKVYFGPTDASISLVFLIK